MIKIPELPEGTIGKTLREVMDEYPEYFQKLVYSMIELEKSKKDDKDTRTI
jgi:hypothetical protein